MPVFDDYAQTTFSHVLNLMGEEAVWLTSNGDEIEGRVLFNYPTKETVIGQTDSYEYPPNNPTAEYYTDTFQGLKEMSDRQTVERLRIRGEVYFITLVDTKFDGDTYIAHLQPEEV